MPAPSPAERRRRLREDELTFAVLLLAGFVCTFTPLPWRLAGLAFIGWAIVLGFQLLARLSALSRRGAVARGHLGIAIGLGACMVIVIELGAQAVFLPAQLDLQECLAGAGTQTARRTCQESFADRLGDLPWP